MICDIKKVKICVPIPIDNVEEVRNAVFQAGAGNIGNYTHCSGTTKCIGTFKPNDHFPYSARTGPHPHRNPQGTISGRGQWYPRTAVYDKTSNRHISSD